MNMKKIEQKMRLDHYINALNEIGKELGKSDAKEVHDYRAYNRNADHNYIQLI